MSNEFRRFTCWTPQSIRETIFPDLGALPQDAESLVEAARVDAPLFSQGRPDPLSLDMFRDFVEGAFNDAQRNSVIAVTGPSGSGKTLVIKWLHTHLRLKAHQHAVYIPRNTVSLPRVLELLLEGLEGEAFETARHAVRTAAAAQVPETQRRQIRDQMEYSLLEVGRLETFNDRERLLLGTPDEASGIYHNGLANLFDTDMWREFALRADGVIDQRRRALAPGVQEKLTEDDLNRAMARFSENDVPPFDGAFFRNHPSLQEIANRVTNAGYKPHVVALLNRALSTAMPQVAGLTDANELFDEVRKTLHAHSRELVLLFEDIAVAGGIEAHWYNQFRNQPLQGRCPLRVVFAATTGHWVDHVPEFVKGALRMQADLRNPDADTEEGERTGLELIARYFNLARLGRAELDEAWEAHRTQADESRSWIPNRCDSCEHKNPCHSGFGEIDGIGLYPLNRRAVHSFLHKLQRDNSNDGGVGYTPRKLVARSTEDWLAAAWLGIGSGVFPKREDVGIFDFNDRDRAELLPDFPENGRETDDANRAYYTRTVWADGPQHSAEIGIAFDLPGTASVRSWTPDDVIWLLNVWAKNTPDAPAQGLDFAAGKCSAALGEYLLSFMPPIADLAELSQFEYSRRLGRVLGHSPFGMQGTAIRAVGNHGHQFAPTVSNALVLAAAYWHQLGGGWHDEIHVGSQAFQCPVDLFRDGLNGLQAFVSEFFSGELVNAVRIGSDAHQRQVFDVGGVSAWANGQVSDVSTRLPDEVVRMTRRTLRELVISRLSLADTFINVKNPLVEHRLGTLLREASFRFEDSFGDVELKDAYVHRFSRGELSANLIKAALWGDSARTWGEIATINGVVVGCPLWIRTEGRLALEVFVDSCAAEIEEKLRELPRAVLEAALAAKALVHIVVAPLEANDTRELVEELLNPSPQEPPSWMYHEFLNAWKNLAGNGVTSVVADLSGVRQGAIGATSGIDAATLDHFAGLALSRIHAERLEQLPISGFAPELDHWIGQLNASLSNQVNEVRHVLERAQASLNRLGDDRPELANLLIELGRHIEALALHGQAGTGVGKWRAVVGRVGELHLEELAVDVVLHNPRHSDAEAMRLASKLPQIDQWHDIISYLFDAVSAIEVAADAAVDNLGDFDLGGLKSRLDSKVQDCMVTMSHWRS